MASHLEWKAGGNWGRAPVTGFGVLAGGWGKTDRHTDTGRMKEGSHPLSPTMIIYPPPIFPHYGCSLGDSSDVGGRAHHVPRHPWQTEFPICCVKTCSTVCENCLVPTVHGAFGQEDTHTPGGREHAEGLVPRPWGGDQGTDAGPRL